MDKIENSLKLLETIKDMHKYVCNNGLADGMMLMLDATIYTSMLADIALAMDTYYKYSSVINEIIGDD